MRQRRFWSMLIIDSHVCSSFLLYIFDYRRQYRAPHPGRGQAIAPTMDSRTELPTPGRGQAIAPTMDGLRRLILRCMVGAMACPLPVTLLGTFKYIIFYG